MDWLRILIICGFAYALFIAFIIGWFRVGARGETPHDVADDIAHGDWPIIPTIDQPRGE